MEGIFAFSEVACNHFYCSVLRASKLAILGPPREQSEVCDLVSSARFFYDLHPAKPIESPAEAAIVAYARRLAAVLCFYDLWSRPKPSCR